MFGKKNFRFLDTEMWKEDLERVGLGRGKHPPTRNQGKKHKKNNAFFEALFTGRRVLACGRKKDFRVDAARELVRSGLRWTDARVARADCSAGAGCMRELPEGHRQVRSRLGCISDGLLASRQGLSGVDCATGSHAVPGSEDGLSSQR